MCTFPSEEAESYLCLTPYTIFFCAWDFATSRVGAGSGSREVFGFVLLCVWWTCSQFSRSWLPASVQHTSFSLGVAGALGKAKTAREMWLLREGGIWRNWLTTHFHFISAWQTIESSITGRTDFFCGLSSIWHQRNLHVYCHRYTDDFPHYLPSFL